MKKLMITAAAALCAAVGLADGISSQNVVGYANDSMTATAWKPVCSQFKTVGIDAEDMTLSDLVPSGGWKYNVDYIKIINSNCGVEKTAYYISQADIDSLPPFLAGAWPTTPGWYQKDGSSATKISLAEEPLPLGSAVLAASASASIFTTSGEVVESQDGKITIELEATKWKFIGNCTPVNLTYNDFVPGGGWKYNVDYIKIINSNCGVEMTAYYISQADIDSLPPFLAGAWPTTPGWYLKDGSSATKTPIGTDSVPAGSGFLAASAAASTISLPSAL